MSPQRVGLTSRYFDAHRMLGVTLTLVNVASHWGHALQLGGSESYQ